MHTRVIFPVHTNVQMYMYVSYAQKHVNTSCGPLPCMKTGMYIIKCLAYKHINIQFVFKM